MLKICLRTVPWLLAALLACAAGAVVFGHARFQPVLTGSMSPRYPAGTIVAVTPVQPAALHVGDIIMFVPPKPYGTPTGGPVMHRIVSMKPAADGHLALRTKGDANAVMDPWTVDANAGGLARLRASSVAAGRAVRLVTSTAHGPALVIWPGVLLLLLASRRGTHSGYRPRHAYAPRRLTA